MCHFIVLTKLRLQNKDFSEFEVLESYKNKTPGVFVLMLEDYLERFWSQLTDINQLYKSLKFSVEESKSKGKLVFSLIYF